MRLKRIDRMWTLPAPFAHDMGVDFGCTVVGFVCGWPEHVCFINSMLPDLSRGLNVHKTSKGFLISSQIACAGKVHGDMRADSSYPTVMGQIHRRLEEHGRQGALALPEIDLPNYRQVFEAAYAFMSSEDAKTGFLFSGWCQTALPHRRLKDDEVWSISTDYVRLMIEPGSIHTGEATSRVGVPYGSRARLILLYLQSEAIRTNSREIQLGRSLRVWLGRLGVPIGGKSMKEVREQALRISRCRMTFQISNGPKTGFVNQNIVDTAMFSEEVNSSLLETVRLSETFFEQLKRHPVPLQETAIRAISNNSQALDIYCWLAYRLHSLSGPCPISWAALHAQFGASVQARRNFKIQFSEALSLAMAVYPEAQVDVVDAGVILRPSLAPVPAKTSVKAIAPARPARRRRST